MLTALAGLAAGALHVVSGPDHLAAVAPLAVAEKRRGWFTGTLWGVGHTVGVWAASLFAFGLRRLLPLESLSLWAERGVGIVLVLLGLWGLRRALSQKLHVHEHHHAGAPHVHLHVHRPGRPHPRAHLHTHGSFAIGLLHGVAGGAHVLGLLPALAMPSSRDAAVYLVAFGAGTVMTMSGFAGAIGTLAARFRGNTLRAYRWLLAGCAGAAIAVGCLWLIP